MSKQLPFGIARGLTKTVKGAQSEILSTVPREFTVRGNWLKPSNKFGIKIKPATKRDLTAEVGTNADWLKLHESGGTKKPSGSNIAIPTVNVKRTKRDIIRRAQRPNALRGKRDVVLKTKKGAVLFQRKFKGKRSKLVPLYNLESRARIRQNSTVKKPGLKFIRRHLVRNISESLNDAMKNAK